MFLAQWWEVHLTCQVSGPGFITGKLLGHEGKDHEVQVRLLDPECLSGMKPHILALGGDGRNRRTTIQNIIPQGFI